MNKSTGKTSISVGDYDVLVEYDGHWDNDGIGRYEFWGAICFDKGMDYFVVDDIRPIFTDETKVEIALIKHLIEDKYEEYAEKIAERVEADVQEGPDDNS